jgi:hypothetical protein
MIPFTEIDLFAYIFESFQNSRKKQIQAINWIYKVNEIDKHIKTQGC